MDGSVILPLYVWPSTGAWDPVFEMASSYPQVQFTAIINPNSGPGTSPLPNKNYSQAISTLNALDNVRTVGYVATTWATKNLSSVLDEVAAYSGWGEYDSSLAMGGIFFDETPTHYTTEYVSYLQNISQAVHESRGLTDAYVVHNPGALPDVQYFSDPKFVESADLTVIFEDTFANWTMHTDALMQATQSYDHAKLALMLHSVPALSNSDTDSALKRLLLVGHNLWLTGTHNYTTLDSYFSVFVDRLDALLS